MSRMRSYLYVALLLIGIGVFASFYLWRNQSSSVQIPNSLPSVKTETEISSVSAKAKAKDEADHTVTVHIKKGTADAQGVSLKNAVLGAVGVTSAAYVSSEQALINFKQTHAYATATIEALQNLDASPFGPEIIISVSNPQVKQSVLDMLRNEDKASIIERIDY